MTIQFSETSPGVHMATWENPSTGIFRTVTIIESLEKFTLYIDGEVVARDLDTFAAAEGQASLRLTAGRSKRMVQVAAVLVAFVAIGGGVIGLSKLMTGASDIALATVSQPANAAQADKITGSPVTTLRTAKPAAVTTVSRSSTKVAAVQKPLALSLEAGLQQAPQTTAVVINDNAAADNSESTIVEANEVEATPIAPTTQPAPAPRVFSASRPALTSAKPAPAPVTTPVSVREATNAISENTVAGPVATTTSVTQREDRPDETTTDAVTAQVQNEPATEQPLTGPGILAVPLPTQKPAVAIARPTMETSTIATAALQPFKVAPADTANTSDATSTSQMTTSSDNHTTARQLAPASNYRAVTKAKKSKKKATRKAKNRRKSRSRRRHTRRRVMRCMYGGCRWVTAGGYYDRQYRRHY